MNITVKDFGPFTEAKQFNLGPGPVVVSGPSGAGKTTLLNLIAIGLWGTMADGTDVVQKAIRGDRAAVRVDLDTVTVRVAVAPGPRWTRRWTSPDENDVAVATNLDLQRRLDAMDPEARYGSRSDVGLTILHPSRWLSLYQQEMGRPLRDVFAKVLPAGDLPATVASLMADAGHEYVEGDPLHLADVKPVGAGRDVKPTPGALTRQTEANAAKSKKEGEVTAASITLRDARAKVDDLKAKAPTDEEVQNAKVINESSVAWGIYDNEKAVYDRQLRHYEGVVSARAKYDAEKAALGEPPVVDEAAASAARIEVDRLRREVENIDARIRAAEIRLAAEHARVEAEAKAEERRKIEEEQAKAKAEEERLAAAEKARIEKEQAERAAAERAVEEERRRVAKAKVDDDQIPLFPGYTEPPRSLPATSFTKVDDAPLATAVAISALENAAASMQPSVTPVIPVSSEPTVTCPSCGHSWSA